MLRVRILYAAVLGMLLYKAAIGAETADNSIDLMKGYWQYHFTLAPAKTDPDMLAEGTSWRWAKVKETVANAEGNKSGPVIPRFFKYQYSGHAETSWLTLLVASKPPSGKWMNPDYDVSDWPRQRLPLLTTKPPIQAAAVKMACYRTNFIVSSPEKAGVLKLRIRYRGGAVVYLNGKEIARGHLPEGEITHGTPGETYPLEAHILPPAVIGKYERKVAKPLGEILRRFPGPNQWVRDRNKGKDPWFPEQMVPDLTTRWSGSGFIGHLCLTRKAWNRIYSLRTRTIDTEIPKQLVHTGTNVIGVEIHRSDYHPAMNPEWWRNPKTGRGRLGGYHRWYGHWQTAFLESVEITGQTAGSVTMESRPGTVQVWTDDIHRRYFNRDFGPSQENISPVRIVGARNGVFSGQIIVGTFEKISEPEVTTGALKGPDGSEIPASRIALRFGVPHPLKELRFMGYCRWGSRIRLEKQHKSVGRLDGARYMPECDWDNEEQRKQVRKQLEFFDHLSETPPDAIPAHTCRPVWITVSVPEKAGPGLYTGSVSLKTAKQTSSVPVQLYVLDWRIPGPKDFETVVACEQSPYGVAKQYGAELWSDEHFRLMEPSFTLLSRVGNDEIIIPVLADSEFGNRQDSMIRWKNKENGSYACDFSRFDRYLALADTYLDPMCVCFVISHPTDNNRFVKPQVVMTDGSLRDVPSPGTEEAKIFWKPCIEGVRTRLIERELEKAWHWGFHWDRMDHKRTGGYVKGTMDMMAELVPGVGWVRAAHKVSRKQDSPFTFVASIYTLPRPITANRRTGEMKIISHKGWKNPRAHLVLTRFMNTVFCMKGISIPYPYRLVCERATAGGARGIARLGADYWKDAYQDGWRGGGQVGTSITALFWPGKQGAESSARFEALLEGIQEAEARIFLEKKLEDKGFSASEQGKAAQKVLDGRIRETLFMPQYVTCRQISEYYMGWKERAWDLYAATAAASGGSVPADTEKKRFLGID